MAAPRLAPIDCVRALVTLSTVFYSATLVATAFMPASGSLWRRLSNSVAFHVLRGGTLQGPLFLLLSGFLLGNTLVNVLKPVTGGQAVTAATSVLARRALRLLTLCLLPLALGLLPGGDCTALSRRQLLLHGLTLSLNTLDIRNTLGVTLPFVLHACIDFQCGVLITVALVFLRALIPSFDAWTELSPAVVAFFAASSIVARTATFQAKVASLSRAAERPHIGFLVTSACGEWAERMMPSFKWRLHVDGRRRGISAASMTTFGELQHDTWNTFVSSPTASMAPMALGVLLALLLNKQRVNHQAHLATLQSLREAVAAKKAAQSSGSEAAIATAKAQAQALEVAIAELEAGQEPRASHILVRWFWTAQAVFTLGVTCLPLGTWTESPQEWLVSAAFPTLAAAAMALLLFTAMCLQHSRWHSPALAAAMSSRLWRPLAMASPAMLALHFPATVALAVGTTRVRPLLPKDISLPAIAALAVSSAGLAALASLPLHLLLRRSVRAQKQLKTD